MKLSELAAKFQEECNKGNADKEVWIVDVDGNLYDDINRIEIKGDEVLVRL